MSKSGPNVSPPDPAIFSTLRCSKGLTVEDLAHKAGISVRTINKLSSGNSKSVACKTMNAICRVLGVSADVLRGLTPAPAITPAEPDIYRIPTDGTPRQEWKHLIVDQSISSSILAGKAPSLAECIRATRMFTPFDDAHKDHPACPQMHYNHFLQISAIITLEDKEQKTRDILAYQRRPRPELSQHVHTQGQSILWSASFPYRLQQVHWGPMDKWMDMAKVNTDGARNLFTAEINSVLAQILCFAVDLRDVPVCIEPYAVISSDQRTGDKSKTGTKRVYTHFVFHFRCSRQSIRGSRRPNIGERNHGIGWGCLPKRAMDERALCAIFSDNATGQLNIMDILAWSAMLSKEQHVQFKTATLVKGFSVA